MGYTYTTYEKVTREVLDSVKVGDLIKVNDWKKPMKVKAVSKNYFVMTQNLFGKLYYSVCSKLVWDGVRYNAMRGGKFHCGTDNWIFGSPISAEYENVYKFENDETNQKYLEEFENGVSELSMRTSIPIERICIGVAAT